MGDLRLDVLQGAGGVCVTDNADVVIVNFSGECLHVYQKDEHGV